MLLVNPAGLVEQTYPQLRHADWHGLTWADVVFPFFLFIVGAAMAFSLAKASTNLTHPLTIYGRIFRRSALLFLLGLLLNGFWSYNLKTLRIMGILQRISLTYLLTALIVLKVPKKGQWAITTVLLVGYWLALTFLPVPEFGAGQLTRTGNFGAYVDRLILGTAHLYAGDQFHSMGDPEGLFSTLPAIATVLLGYFTGDWLRQRTSGFKIQTRRQSCILAFYGLISLGLGLLWNIGFPINKKLWTSSYVLFTVGISLILLAACYELIEVRRIRLWSKPFEVLGLNAIAIFVASVLGIKILVLMPIGSGAQTTNVFNWLFAMLFLSWTSAEFGSLVFALLTLCFWWMVAYGLYRQRWFFKL
jgi:predicted acyltransferase